MNYEIHKSPRLCFQFFRFNYRWITVYCWNENDLTIQIYWYFIDVVLNFLLSATRHDKVPYRVLARNFSYFRGEEGSEDYFSQRRSTTLIDRVVIEESINHRSPEKRRSGNEHTIIQMKITLWYYLARTRGNRRKVNRHEAREQTRRTDRWME